jgi:hypothetical protein
MENKKNAFAQNQKLMEEIHQFLREIDEIATRHLTEGQPDLLYRNRNFIKNSICSNVKKIHVRIDKLN